ncbi:cardiolipin synthase [Planococcus sp. CPCC 101016]|uniref:cardiolipin synthase n=1 Tax=Planococcus sp. CPCC 101016 TaxID=2599617 RepID=UPI0028F6D25E|nr:cardiolipin synthase [Planococcus sp. CPCC 101016]
MLTNTVLAFFILFSERKRATSKWAWIMTLFFLPFVGFLLYLLFGLPHNKRKGKHATAYSNPEIRDLSKGQLAEIDQGSFEFPSVVAEEWQALIRLNAKSKMAPLTHNNRLRIYTDGKRKFDALIKDIEKAENHIHLEYYLLKNDEIGNRLLDLLIEKASHGLEVLVLYDDLGSKSLPNNFFKEFFRSGGKAAASLPSRLPFTNPRLNYRNHRKIAIIDGKMGYIGGFNIGDEYLGRNGQFGYWRDTHLRIEGTAVHFLQHQFLTDWNQATQEHPVFYDERYFPSAETIEGAAMQIVASGPDEPVDQIKNGFLKMIAQARKSVYIQTPYLVPDLAILDVIRTASLSGVDVRIMIPSKADHLFIHSASLSYAKNLLDAGAKIYAYGNGFLHAKTVVVDGMIFSVGSANMDIRSFSLNFEANAFIYDAESAEEMIRIFFSDVTLSQEITSEYFENLSLFKRFKLQIARLLAPIL